MKLARGAVLFALLSGGCALRATAVLQRSAVRGVMTENRVALSTLSTTESDLLGVDHGATVSEASLVAVTEHELCADVLVRTWQGAAADWDLRVRVDGAEQAASRWPAMECREGQCLPSDRRVFPLLSDRDPRVQVRGGRVCAPLAAGTTARREIALELRQGALQLEFQWLLTGAPSGRLARR
ncbi:MAG: hypothetical protein U0324_03805 [Polyangiales bacterium]